MKLQPFTNESDSESIGEMTIENRLDRVSLYGSLEITKDKKGLKQAQELQKLINSIVTTLQSQKLPDNIIIAQSEIVKNPFV